jgi:restriction system protein
MPVPDYQTLMRPVLTYAADGKEKNIREVTNAIADEFHLTDQERSQLLPSGKQSALANRVHWARTYLAKAEALKNTRRSHFVITDRGRQLLEKYPKRVDVAILDLFPEFKAFRALKKSDDEKPDAATKDIVAPKEISSVTPEEAIQVAVDEITKTLQAQLLDRIFERSPAFFEQLVVDLIVAMGYGGSRGAVAQRLGGSGDEGIDGVVNEDVLGLDAVYLQAKRYKKDNPVHRPMIQQFAGALVGQGASKGVFITTSSFSSGAIDFAKQVPQRIVLIDGEKLGKLMIQYGVGVRAESTVEIKPIDLDYFEEDED